MTGRTLNAMAIFAACRSPSPAQPVTLADEAIDKQQVGHPQNGGIVATTGQLIRPAGKTLVYNGRTARPGPVRRRNDAVRGQTTG